MPPAVAGSPATRIWTASWCGEEEQGSNRSSNGSSNRNSRSFMGQAAALLGAAISSSRQASCRQPQAGDASRTKASDV